MDTDAIIGCVAITGTVIAMILLVWWSRRTIDWISRTGQRSAREIMRDIRRGK